MKNRRKGDLIFLAILAAVFLVALLDGSGIQSAAADEEQGLLIGVYVTRDHLDLGDLTVSPTGQFGWRQGRIYAEQTEKSWRFPDDLGGAGVFCAMTDVEEGVLAGERMPQVVNIGELGEVKSSVHVSDEDGVRVVDAVLSGEVYACEGEPQRLYCNPVYQLPDGRIYLTSGQGMSSAGDSAGERMTMTLSGEVTQTEGSRTETYRVRAEITSVTRLRPERLVVLYMDEADNVLAREEFASGALPERITPVEGTAYVLAENRGSGQETADCVLIERSGDTCWIRTFRMENGGMVPYYVKLDWKEAAA